MIWIAPSEKDTGSAALEKQLRDAVGLFAAEFASKHPCSAL